MSARAYVHIGPPKTGSTYLQSILWRNRDALHGQGLKYSAAHDNEHFLAAYDVQGGEFVHGEMPEAAGAWERVAARVRGHAGRSLISHELLALSRPEHIRRIVASLQPVPVDVIIMGRCLADVLPSIYQEKVKQRDPEVSWPDFLRDARRPDGMWGYRLGSLVRRWLEILPPNRIHVVTVPPAEAPRRCLLERFSRVVGIDAAALDVRGADANDSLDIAGVVSLQQVVRRTRASLSWHEHRDLMSSLLPVLRAANLPGSSRLVMPASSRSWMGQEATEGLLAVEESGCPVYGDPADLLPRPACFGSDDSGLEAPSIDAAAAAAADALLAAAAGVEPRTVRRLEP